MRERLVIIVVGAGIAGLSAAISCALGGHEVHVFEGAKELAEVGAGFQITPNASKILFKWGLEDAMRKTWAEPTTLTVHRYSDGKILAHDPLFSQHVRQKYNAPFIDMHRVDMQRILYEKAVELGTTIRLNSRIISVRQNCSTGMPEVVLQDGSTVQGDLVVGADGLWSKCRESMVGSSDPPLPTGDLAYRIVLEQDQVEDEDLKNLMQKPTVHFWIGPKSHVVAYSVRSGTMQNIVLLTPDNLPSNVARQSGSIQEMKELFKGWDPLLTRLLDCVQEVDKWKLMHRAELKSWTNEERNFLLIGDSSHSMLPYLAQGANSSIEDGAVLGRVLSYINRKSELAEAVSLFERLRKTRGEQVARETFLQREDFHMEDGPQQERRDALFQSQLSKSQPEVKFPSRWTCPEVQTWLYGYDAYEAVDKILRDKPQPFS